MNLYESSEDYLERILILKERIGKVRSVDIARDMGFSKPSISRAINNLKENDYLVVNDDGSLELTKKGQEIAEKIYEKHMLLAEWFIQIGVSEKQAYIDSCKIEHDISDETFDKIKEQLKNLKNKMV